MRPGEVISASWKYVRTTIPDCQNWVVGKCVRDNVDDLSLDRTRWFYQPGAGLGKAQKTIQEAQLRRFRDELAALLVESGPDPDCGNAFDGGVSRAVSRHAVG